MKALVSIITVNYNGLRDTCEMIDSFRSRETYPRYEIIVVDNGSRLPEAEEIQERYRDNPVPGGSLSGSPVSFPPVKVVRNINNGFAGGNNAGLKAAEGDYLFFINNDTLIKEPVLDALVRRIESDSPRNGGVSPMLKFAARPDTLQYAASPPEPRHPAQRGHRLYAARQPPLPHPPRNRLAAWSRHDGEPAGVAGRRHHERGLFPVLRGAGLVGTAPESRATACGTKPAAVVYHKEGMTARRGSRHANSTCRAHACCSPAATCGASANTCRAPTSASSAAPKKAAVYLLHGQVALAKATICGTCEGIYKKYPNRLTFRKKCYLCRR